MPVSDYLPEWDGVWDEVEHNPIAFFNSLLGLGVIDQETFDREFEAVITPEIPPGIPPELEAEIWGQVQQAVYEKQNAWWRMSWREMLAALWAWIKENVTEFFGMVWQYLKDTAPPLLAAANAKISEYGRDAYKYFDSLLLKRGPITPEDAPGLAVKMLGVALAAGTTAHLSAVAMGLFHPFKQIGLTQLTGLIAQLGSFGPVFAATVGVVQYGALRRPMGYAVNRVTRSQLPDDRLAIEFRSKREITYDEFEELMSYAGYSDRWIKRVESWQWKDPRMLEIMRMAEDPIIVTDPPADLEDELDQMGITGDRRKDWWLWRKFMRAGYEDCDIPNMVMAIHRKGIHNALTYFKTALRRNYRWGFATEEDLEDGMRDMGLTGEYVGWTKRAGELDREYFLKQDLIRQYKLAYRNDLMTDREFGVALALLGLPPRTVTTWVTTEKVRKTPKVTRAVESGREAAAAKIQTTYTSLYIEQFRKGLIDESGLLESLLAIGILPDLAELTVELESTRRLPKPQLEEIT